MTKKRRELKWSMIVMLTICWFLPLLLLSFVMLFFVSNKMNRQLENTIITSADKAIEICQIRLNEAMAASKDASYMPEIKDSYQAYLRDGDREKLYHDVALFVERQYRFNTDFNLTVLYFLEQPEKLYFTYSQSSSTYSSIQSFRDQVQPRVTEISEVLDTSIVFVNIGERLYMVRNIVDSSFTPFAVIVMELNAEHMFGSLESIWGYTRGDVFIDGISLFHEYPADPCRDMIRERVMTNTDYYHGSAGSYAYKRLESGRHRIAYAIELDSEAIVGELEMIRSLLFMLLLFMLPLIIVVFLFFNQKVNKPISGLRRACREIEKEHYGYHIEPEGQDEEFYDLGAAFNSMSDKLKYQFEKIYLEELALKDANIMALQSQINPHFLNNTLEIINWEARMAENYKVSRMIEALSTMMEATMNRKSEPLISLSEEMNYVDAYLHIISQRFGENFKVCKEMDESLMRVRVPRLIIQPIIENAVEHGLNVRRQGQIRISSYRREDKVYIEVMDSGTLTQEDMEKIGRLLGDDDTKETHSVSLGIRNVNKRLKIIYGSDCGLTIKSNKEGQTVSTIIVKIDNP